MMADWLDEKMADLLAGKRAVKMVERKASMKVAWKALKTVELKVAMRAEMMVGRKVL